MMFNLKNKKAVITGATGGIGYSILEKFYSEGVTVLGSGTNEEKLNKLKSDFNGMILKKFDISKHDEIEKFVDNVCDELGGCPEILINNAGIGKSKKIDEIEIKDFIDVFEVQSSVEYNALYSEIRHMLKIMIFNKLFHVNIYL